MLEWNGKLLQGATFKEVYNIILESKPEPQVELVVSRPLGWERRRNPKLLLNLALTVFKAVMLWDWLLSINSEEPGRSSPTHSCPQATILKNWPHQPFHLERLPPKENKKRKWFPLFSYSLCCEWSGQHCAAESASPPIVLEVLKSR